MLTAFVVSSVEFQGNMTLNNFRKLRADGSQGMLAVIRCGIFLSSSLLSKNVKIF
jgi:hypothetical protein